jgi:hypothetical protein
MPDSVILETKRDPNTMVLLDHFRPPLSTKRHWHSFHNAWLTYLSEDLNQRLPEGYFAEPNAQFGLRSMSLLSAKKLRLLQSRYKVKVQIFSTQERV